MPDMKPVNARTIKAIGYDAQKQRLSIQFKNYKIYEIENVPKHTYNSLMAAPSVDDYFITHLCVTP